MKKTFLALMLALLCFSAKSNAAEYITVKLGPCTWQVYPFPGEGMAWCYCSNGQCSDGYIYYQEKAGAIVGSKNINDYEIHAYTDQNKTKEIPLTSVGVTADTWPDIITGLIADGGGTGQQ
ncbi:MAG: hypothetical protein ACTHJ0_01770 [Flavipsychrobacter sp.]